MVSRLNNLNILEDSLFTEKFPHIVAIAQNLEWIAKTHIELKGKYKLFKENNIKNMEDYLSTLETINGQPNLAEKQEKVYSIYLNMAEKLEKNHKKYNNSTN